MRTRKGIFICMLAAVLLVGACSSEQDINRAKFDKLSGAAHAVKASLAAGASYRQFSESLQKLSAEITALTGKATSGKEAELLKAYSTLLGIYQDGQTLWKYKLEFAPFDFVPKGRIYVSQDVEPLAFKYNLPVESHLYEPTGQYWKSISEDSIQIIWNNADTEFKIIEGTLHP